MIKTYIIKNILPPVLIFTLISFSYKKYGKPENDIPFEPLFTPIDHTYDSIISSFDSYMKEAQLNNYFPGAAVVITKENRILFRKCYGVKEFGTKDSVDIHTVFRLGSVSKGLLQYWQEFLSMRNNSTGMIQ